MSVQTIFQAGNSQTAVVIPKHISDQLGLKKGHKVMIDVLPGENALVIKKGKKTAKSQTKDAFNRWLNAVLEEDAEILDELANR